MRCSPPLRSIRSGTLHIVATPLGNASDLSPRALATLQRVPLLLAEDTRVVGRLLAPHGGTSAALLSTHSHNESARVSRALAALAGGQDVALVSDAGTPCMSDPGAVVVAAALRAGARVSPVPGPCSFTAALSCAGLTRAPWADAGGPGALLVGFLPRSGPLRSQWMTRLAGEHARRSVVLLEAPHRLAATLAELAAAHTAAWPRAPPRVLLVVRELTKSYEHVHLTELSQAAQDAASAADALAELAAGGDAPHDERPSSWAAHVSSPCVPLGEFVLVLHPMEEPHPGGAADNDEPDAPAAAMAEAVVIVSALVAGGGTLSDAVRAAAAVSGLRRKALALAVASQMVAAPRKLR